MAKQEGVTELTNLEKKLSQWLTKIYKEIGQKPSDEKLNIDTRDLLKALGGTELCFYLTCPRCGGTGRYWGTAGYGVSDCTRCYGKGRVHFWLRDLLKKLNSKQK